MLAVCPSCAMPASNSPIPVAMMRIALIVVQARVKEKRRDKIPRLSPETKFAMALQLRVHRATRTPEEREAGRASTRGYKLEENRKRREIIEGMTEEERL
jgi:hypothetical protein